MKQQNFIKSFLRNMFAFGIKLGNRVGEKLGGKSNTTAGAVAFVCGCIFGFGTALTLVTGISAVMTAATPMIGVGAAITAGLGGLGALITAGMMKSADHRLGSPVSSTLSNVFKPGKDKSATAKISAARKTGNAFNGTATAKDDFNAFAEASIRTETEIAVLKNPLKPKKTRNENNDMKIK